MRLFQRRMLSEENSRARFRSGLLLKLRRLDHRPPVRIEKDPGAEYRAEIHRPATSDNAPYVVFEMAGTLVSGVSWLQSGSGLGLFPAAGDVELR